MITTTDINDIGHEAAWERLQDHDGDVRLSCITSMCEWDSHLRIDVVGPDGALMRERGGEWVRMNYRPDEIWVEVLQDGGQAGAIGAITHIGFEGDGQ